MSSSRLLGGVRLRPALRVAAAGLPAAVLAAAMAAAPALHAEPVAAAPAATAASSAAPTAAATSATRVIEDDQVRIEETRVRGQLRRIVVAPKSTSGQAAVPYEINVGTGGRDPSQDHGSAGQRVWSLFRF